MAKDGFGPPHGAFLKEFSEPVRGEIGALERPTGWDQRVIPMPKDKGVAPKKSGGPVNGMFVPNGGQRPAGKDMG